MERNYEGVSYFDYNAYLGLVDKIKHSDSPDAADDLEAADEIVEEAVEETVAEAAEEEAAEEKKDEEQEA